MDLMQKIDAKLNEAKRKVKVQYRVSPVGKKMRYYDDISKLSSDFNVEELKNAHISVIFNGVIVGDLNTDQVLRELY